MKKINVVIALLVIVVLGYPLSSMAVEKSYKEVNGTIYLRCQPVPNYSGKVNSANVGSVNDWWLIKMKPSAAWNSPRCVATGNELVFENGKPVKNVICGNKVVEFKKIQQNTVAPPVIVRATPVVATQKVMRICVPGTGCDERSFTGMVPSGALKASGGVSIDVLEFHYRPNKSGTEYKVKRLRVMPDGVAYPMQWVKKENGKRKCVRMYSDKRFTQAQLKALLLPGETFRDAKISELGLKSVGAHLTEAVVLIEGSASSASTESATVRDSATVRENVQVSPSGQPRTFLLALPIGNRM